MSEVVGSSQKSEVVLLLRTNSGRPQSLHEGDKGVLNREKYSHYKSSFYHRIRKSLNNLIQNVLEAEPLQEQANKYHRYHKW